MKNLLFNSFKILVLTIFFFGCSKEESRLANEIPSTTRATAPIVLDGILSFNDYEQVKNHMTSLMNSDKDIATKNINYDAIGITELERSSSDFYTMYPASELFDLENSFISLRQIKENEINSRLNQGDETVFSILSQPYFKAVLNVNRAVRVGSRIFINYRSGLTVMISNNDMEAYQYAIGTSEIEVSNRFNLRVFHKFAAPQYFEKDAFGNQIQKNIVSILIDEQEQLDGTIRLVNSSLVELDNEEIPTFTWTYSDGTSEIANQPTKILSTTMTYEVQAKGKTKGGNGGGTVGGGSGPRYCSPGYVDQYITKLSGNRYRFSFNPSHPDDDVRWTISCENHS